MIKEGFLFTLFILAGFLLSCSNRSDNPGNSGISPSEQSASGRMGDKNSTEYKISDEVQRTVKDIDGNVYGTVRIGSQTWMTKNLKTTKYNDGTAIPLVTGAESWAALTTPGYCWYDNDSASYKPTYGALYNGYVVMTGKLCPAGWHVPSNAEWVILTDYLGGLGFAGERLKETGTNYWVGPNTGATNESGFTALPGGFCYNDGLFHDFGFGGYWWTSTEHSSSRLYFRYMDYESYEVFNFNNLKKNGFSVRCLQD